MIYLGTYIITPNQNDIEVECFGTSYPAQKETLEQEGINAHSELEVVKHGHIDITGYLTSDYIEYLQTEINNGKQQGKQQGK